MRVTMCGRVVCVVSPVCGVYVSDVVYMCEWEWIYGVCVV